VVIYKNMHIIVVQSRAIVDKNDKLITSWQIFDIHYKQIIYIYQLIKNCSLNCYLYLL